MKKILLILLHLLFAAPAFSQKWSATANRLMKGTLVKGSWQYGEIQKVKSIIEFDPGSLTINDSSGVTTYRLMKDVVTKQMEEDSCITSLRTGYDRNNTRCMVNLVEFFNGMNVLNILFANVSYTYYFRHQEVDNPKPNIMAKPPL